MAHKTPQFQSGSKEKQNNKGMDAAQVWMHDMVEWCERVRLDIIRLEGACGFAATSNGDPGPPPEDPWE